MWADNDDNKSTPESKRTPLSWSFVEVSRSVSLDIFNSLAPIRQQSFATLRQKIQDPTCSSTFAMLYAMLLMYYRCKFNLMWNGATFTAFIISWSPTCLGSFVPLFLSPSDIPTRHTHTDQLPYLPWLSSSLHHSNAPPTPPRISTSLKIGHTDCPPPIDHWTTTSFDRSAMASVTLLNGTSRYGLKTNLQRNFFLPGWMANKCSRMTSRHYISPLAICCSLHAVASSIFCSQNILNAWTKQMTPQIMPTTVVIVESSQFSWSGAKEAMDKLSHLPVSHEDKLPKP